MKKLLWLFVPAVLLLTAAAIRARTAPVRPEPKPIAQEIAAPASFGTVLVKGQKQGLILNKAEVLGFDIQYTSPFNGSGVQHPFGAFIFTKRITPGSIGLITAGTQNENLTQVTFHFSRPNAEGTETEYYRVDLLNAGVASIRQFINVVQKDGSTDKLPTEQVTLTFEKITFSSIPDEHTISAFNIFPIN